MPTLIKTVDELRDVFDQLTTNLDYGLPSFSNKLSTNATNDMLTQVEDQLNRLYEKTRLTEDLNTFTEEYIQNAYKQNVSLFEKSLKVIEQESDKLLNTKKQFATISFGNNAFQTTDRDGLTLRCADNIREVLLPASEIVQIANASIVTTTSNAKPYRQTLKPINQYRTFYCEDTPLNTEINEEIRVLFEHNIKINYISIASFKSSIESLAFIQADNNELYNIDVTADTCVFPDIIAKGFVVVLKSSAYDIFSIEAANTDNESFYSDLGMTATEMLLDTIYDTIVAKVGG